MPAGQEPVMPVGHLRVEQVVGAGGGLVEAVGGCGGHCQYSSRHLPHTVLGVLEFPPHLPHPLCQRVDSTLTDYTIL